MVSIKKQFSDLRQSTPKHIQWLLLVAAFIVVLILLTLLLTGKKDKKIEINNDVPINLTFSPNTDSIDWADTQIGESRNQVIKISATAPAKILDIRRTADAAGLSLQQTCGGIGQINPKDACTLVLEYKPTESMTPKAVSVYIDYRGADEPDAMKKTDKLVLVLGALSPVTEKKEEPIIEPVIEPVVPIETPKPAKVEIKQEIESIAPSDPFAFEDIAYVDEPDTIETIETMESPAPQAEACSDFAFPGYNTTGTQIGWIRPERGAYYFHPFSDKNCDTPTGVYNPDNGIITDINNSAQKIGTDAEHIGYTTISGGAIPQLSNPATGKGVNKARQLTTEELSTMMGGGGMAVNGQTIPAGLTLNPAPASDVIYSTSGTYVASTQPFDRTFILRQYKPIPATIVSDIRADAALINGEQFLPVRATVDRNVYSDNGRTIIIPTGTLLLGYVTGNVPGPYKSIGRMEIQWYQFVLPNGVEFNFNGNNPFSGDSQGRVGVPGRGSTDYLEQFIMPMLTAIVPAAVNMIAPVADKFVNQIDLDNNTVVQSGTVRSSELAKNEIITAWNQVAQKLMIDMMDNTVPPFTIPAGTRITVYSPEDLAVVCLDDSKKCSMKHLNTKSATGNARTTQQSRVEVDPNDGSWVGQARSFNMDRYCTQNAKGVWEVDSSKAQEITLESGYSYSTVVAFCQSKNYQAINSAKQDAIYQNQQQQFQNNYNVSNTGTGLTGIQGDQSYNEDVLGLKYNEDGSIENPFQSNTTAEETAPVITCEDGTVPDANGCCTGEIFTDMGEQGFNCCPETGGDCFPPIL